VCGGQWPGQEEAKLGDLDHDLDALAAGGGVSAYREKKRVV
jgi:hypothetical protein